MALIQIDLCVLGIWGARAELRSVSCAYLANASSTEFLPFQQIIKYSTTIPSNRPGNLGDPQYTYSPYESFTVPFLQGSANPTDPNFNNHAMFNYSGKYVFADADADADGGGGADGDGDGDGVGAWAGAGTGTGVGADADLDGDGDGDGDGGVGVGVGVGAGVGALTCSVFGPFFLLLTRSANWSCACPG